MKELQAQADVEHTRAAALTEAQNEPYRLWKEQVMDIWDGCADTGAFGEALEALQSATNQTFRLQLAAPKPEELSNETE
jgi:hypothetical protein